MVVTRLFAAAVIEHIGGLRHTGTVHADQSGGNIFRRHGFQQPGTQRPVFVLDLDRGRIEVSLHRCVYDIEAVARGLARHQLPALYIEMFRTGTKLN